MTEATAGIPIGDKKKTTFLDLPPELREEIYRYTFTISVWIGDRGKNAEVKLSGDIIQRRNAGVLLACRTTYHEAIMLYYKLTTFDFSRISALRNFLSTISEQKRLAIPEIRCQNRFSPDWKVDRRLWLLQRISMRLSSSGCAPREGVLKTYIVKNGVEVWISDEKATDLGPINEYLISLAVRMGKYVLKTSSDDGGEKVGN